MNEYVTFHRVLDLIEEFQKQSPILNTFAYGNLVDFGQLHVSGGTVEYPFIFAVPQSITYDENTTTYQLSLIFADLLNYDLSNEKDCVSDMSLEAKRFLSYLKRGIRTFPDLYDNLDINFPVSAIPFFERFGDHVGGVAMDCNLIIFEDLNACDFYPTPTPTAEPTNTPTPTPSATPVWDQMWVAGGNGPTKIVYSTDGITWSGSDVNTIFTGATQIVYEIWSDGTKFVASSGSSDEAPLIAYSDNGINWFAGSGITSNGTGAQVREVRSNGNYWIAGGRILTSDLYKSNDGITWTAPITTGLPIRFYMRGLMWDGTKWYMGLVRLAPDPPTLAPFSLYSSFDGENWTGITTSGALTTVCRTIEYNGSVYLAGGLGGDILVRSTDGINFTSVSGITSFITLEITDLIWDGTYWTAVGGAGDDNIAISTDGISWSGITTPATNTEVRSIAYNGSRYVAASVNGGTWNMLMYSNDGLSYSASTNYNDFGFSTVEAVGVSPNPYVFPPIG